MRLALYTRSLVVVGSALAVLLLLLSGPLAGQALLRPGTAASGELKSGDIKLDDDTYVDLWRFSGSAGQAIRVTMRSDAFDAYLAVGYIDDAGEWHLVKADDDGAGGSNAQVTAALPRDGEYTVRANTLVAGETGVYTLLLEANVSAAAGPTAPSRGAVRVFPPLVTGTPIDGDLRPGDELLDDDSFADTYRFEGRRGQQLEVTLRSSEFDAYLAFGRLGRDGSFDQIDSDDDGAGNTDARILVTLDADGTYLVRANTLFKNKTGRYTLAVTTGGGAPAAVTRAAAAPGTDPLVSSVPGARMPVVLAQELSGRLGPGDDTIADGSHADIWVYQGQQGETLTMVQRSKEVDAYLTFGPVVDGHWRWEKSDNDGAGGDDAKLVVTLPSAGEYWIRPNALFAGEGAYTLLVTSDRTGPAPPAANAAAPAPTPSQSVPSAGPLQQGLNLSKSSKGPTATVARRVKEIRKGEETRGQLTGDDEDSGDGTFVDTYVFEGRKGQVAIVSMKSEAFRPYLLIGRAPADSQTFSSIDSDGAPLGEAAKVTIELPANGKYWIRANTFDKATGRYTLKLRIR